MSTVFIVNPAARHGRGGNFWRRVAPLVRERFGEHRLRWTRGRGHASGLVQEELGQGATRLIAVGGDGTLNEVVDGFLKAPAGARREAAVGCLPAGSGCDFARHFGVPPEPRDWLPVLAKAPPRPIDAGLAFYVGPDGRERETHFINVAAFGLAGDVVFRLERSGKLFGGTVSYLVTTVSALLRARARPLRLTIDGKTRHAACHMVAVANTSSTGGGMRIAPRANAADGRLDMITIGEVSRLKLLRHFPKIYAGTHLGIAGVTAGLVRELVAETDEEVLLNLDGEASGRLPARFRVLPGALPALLP